MTPYPGYRPPHIPKPKPPEQELTIPNETKLRQLIALGCADVAHGDLPLDSSRFEHYRGDEVNRSVVGTTLLENKSGSRGTVLAFLLCQVNGGY